MKGAFTGAMSDRRGKFELADGGTLFLDEIADMSLKTQAKVLRALQEQVVEPVGGAASVRVDVRVLAATNKDLPAEIRLGRFREDLYFRLNVIPIFVPPLRDRPDDILLLAQHFMTELSREYGRRPKQFDAGAAAGLRSCRWPGNVRELHNVVERLMIMVPGDTIHLSDLSFLDAAAIVDLEEPAPVAPLHEARDRFEREYILNLYRKMRGFGIAPSRRVEGEEEPV
jgi:two-component system nitrogen regulation response regulator NtrX